jgi:hypothetical protein
VYVWDVTRHHLPGNHEHDYPKHSDDEMCAAQAKIRSSQPGTLSKDYPQSVVRNATKARRSKQSKALWFLLIDLELKT